MEVPRIVSTDDHVVEPSHVWSDWLPAKYRQDAPRIEQRTFSSLDMIGPGVYDVRESDEGETGDCWIYEDRLVYVHKRHVTIPLDATPGGDLSSFDHSVMTTDAITYEEMRPGCYEPKARLADMDANWVEASLCFPTLPRFCGQTFLEGHDKELGLACVKAYNDWMIEEWCGDSAGRLIPLCLIPLWDAELAAAEVRRNADRGARAVCFSEGPTHLGLPSIFTGLWNPFFEACDQTGTVVCLHVGSSSKMPITSSDAPPAVRATMIFNHAMGSLADYLFSGLFVRFTRLRVAYSEGQIGWIPYVLERADTVWNQHDSWQKSKQLIPQPPSSYYYDHVFGCFTADRHGLQSLAEVGEDNITFETDFPHSDTTWPRSKEYVTKLLEGFSDEVAYKVLRGNAIRMLQLSTV